MAQRRVLIVDDDRALRETMQEILEMEGYLVRVAEHGAAGLEALNNELPDAMVLDIEMPVLDGPDMVYRMLLEDAGRENIPVILVSGHSDLVRIAARIGTVYMLPKPSGLDKFLDIVERAIRERRALSPAPAFLDTEGSHS